jgi:diguanylate cyclase (GGDEF)-like protein
MASTKRLPLVRSSNALTAPACIVQIYGEPLGRRFELSEQEVTIGRDDDSTIALRLQSVSRRHARIFQRDGHHWVEDLGSTNGTLVNDFAVAAPAQLRNGDLIKCGGAVFKFIEGGNVESLYHEEIHRLTITDGLTQLANKRHFAEFLEREIARAARHQRPLALVLFDIDHFKKINDEHGHVAGDRVLCGVADLISPQIRQDELLARWGGEEFALVLPESGLESAERVAERLRRLVEQAEFEHDAKMLRVTISAGVTTLRNDDTSRSLIERADAQLYRAKEGGRNRVCSE